MTHVLGRGVRYCISTLGLAALLLGEIPAAAATMDYKDWTASFSGGSYVYSNTSAAGTISGTSGPCGGVGCIGNNPGTWGVATAITPKQFTNEFTANGQKPGSSMNFLFSVGYGWGTGGEMLIGNIHNYFEYTIEAWDFLGNAIDVNTWTTPSGQLSEYLHGAPGQLGYFSTSSTGRCAGGAANIPSGQAVCPGSTSASNFFVYDTGADTNGGQGGVLALGGLINVGRIQVTLASSSLAPNGQSGDLLLFNVGTPVPEPSTAAMLGLPAGLSCWILWKRRRRLA